MLFCISSFLRMSQTNLIYLLILGGIQRPHPIVLVELRNVLDGNLMGLGALQPERLEVGGATLDSRRRNVCDNFHREQNARSTTYHHTNEGDGKQNSEDVHHHHHLVQY